MQGVEGYNKFIQDMDQLPKPKVLDVKGLSTKQHLGPAMLDLLAKCNHLTKLKINISFPILVRPLLITFHIIWLRIIFNLYLLMHQTEIY